ncbi:methyltransferase regulatory domain-containing protein [Pasteurella sp. PK-2025]|uniref:methyltransferase regulatory domain-containing protein n=1 Tax=Pasteurella sp. PK-2025 TaxID=3413133 RepID=UPI003C76E62D
MEKINLIKESYNELPYISKSFVHTLPERQKAVLSLLGFQTPEIKGAHVLEIGCGFGGNIIAYALANPDTHFMGIDLSDTQIEGGREVVKQLGLTNVELCCADISEFNKPDMKFDYIICHGVFSWVPAFVRESILKVIKSHLAENGSAIISYNTYPGWKSLEVLRDIMRFRVDTFEKQNMDLNLLNKVAYGRGAVAFLKEFALGNPQMKEICKRIDEGDDHYIYHEYHEEYNQPLYLYEFNALLEKQGLAHICDSTLNKTFPIFENDDIEKMLSQECGNDQVLKEQYYDYLLNSQFRTSIVTHLENKAKCNISRDIKIKDLDNLYIRGKIQEDSPPELIRFLDRFYPQTIKVSDFIEKHVEGDKSAGYAAILVQMYNQKIEFFARDMPLVKTEKLKLKAGYAKYFAYHLKTAKPVVSLSNFVGSILSLTQHELETMLLCDGTRTDQDLVSAVIDKIHSGEWHITTQTENEKPNPRPIVERFVKDIRYFIESHFMNE